MSNLFGVDLKSPTSMRNLKETKFSQGQHNTQSAKVITIGNGYIMDNYLKKEDSNLRSTQHKNEHKFSTALSPRVNNFIKSSKQSYSSALLIGKK